VLGKKISGPSGPGRDKTSILISLKDRVGALHDLLGGFRDAGINLTKIESRPSRRKTWEYVFFIDFLGHVAEPKVQKVMKNLKEHSLFLKLLGSYPRGDM
jgi:chorismate mutase/prephenate dehydratase